MTAGFIALSLILWTHNSSDPGFSRFTSEQEVSNIFGTAGAWISDLIYLLFGWGVWIFAAGALFFLIRGIKRIRGRSVTTTIYPMGFRIFAFVLLLLSAWRALFPAVSFLLRRTAGDDRRRTWQRDRIRDALLDESHGGDSYFF